MSLDRITKAINDKSLHCPVCTLPIQKFSNYVDMATSVWDGAGDSNIETGGSKVTLICGNDNCSWKQRTEYWQNYLHDN